ncbi:MAG: hypothetical protein RL318_2108 [Fibrobacterota bacterium]|jgi:TolB-like protein
MSIPRVFALIAAIFLASEARAQAQAVPKDKLPMVAVLPLDARGLTTEEAQVMTEMLGSELLQTGSFRVMERSQMDKILSEQGFQKSGACDNSQCAVEMGQMLGIERMVVGSIGKVGRTFLVSVRMVNVASGEIMRSVSRTTTSDVDDILTRMLPIVAKELSSNQVETARHPLLPPAAPLVAAKVDSSKAPPPGPASPEPKVEEKKSSAGKWIIATLLVGGAGGAAWYFLGGSGAQDAPASNETGTTRTASFSWNP